jgi:hypothetical protein
MPYFTSAETATIIVAVLAFLTAVANNFQLRSVRRALNDRIDEALAERGRAGDYLGRISERAENVEKGGTTGHR